MADIVPNTEYITINKGGVFVGWRLVVLKPATTYRGVNICEIDNVKATFAWIQEHNKNITELHVLSSKTWGEFAKVGNPSREHGGNAWCRVKYNDGKLGDWVFCSRSCANLCALNCARNLRAYDDTFRLAVCGTFDNGQNGKDPQPDYFGSVDWSKYRGVNNVGPYRIIVEEVGPHTK